MKKINSLYFLLPIFLMGLSACTHEDDGQLWQGKEIKLSHRIIPSTRVAGQGLQSTQIAVGRTLGVTITGAQSAHANAAWTVREDGSLTPVEEKVKWGNTEIGIVAYHPHDAQWTGSTHTFTVCTDQGTEEGYLSSDLLWATATASPADQSVNLGFTHKLAKLSVALSSDDIDDLSGAEVLVCATMVSAGFNPLSGELAGAAGSVAEISAGNLTESISTLSAIVVPQKVKAGSELIKIVHAGKEYKYTLLEDMTFKSGYSYHLVLKILGADTPKVVKIVSGGVNDMDNVEW